VHRVFDSPTDAIIFDTGHQAYVHKILTGRQDQFERLKMTGGLSGYPNRAESEHDLVENSHASTALSYARRHGQGVRADRRRRHVVAVVGDGALTGGMCWEALNNIAVAKDRNLVIVVNDNGWSYQADHRRLADRSRAAAAAGLRADAGCRQAGAGADPGGWVAWCTAGCTRSRPA